MVATRNASPWFSCPDLQQFYSEKYDERTLRWRGLCAIEKAHNIERIVGDLQTEIESVLDVGCGTGDVISNLAKRGIGRRFTGIEIGTERSRESRRDDVHIHGYDGHRIPYDDQSFDLVYATHVLEHVTDEREFLGELRRVSRRLVYIEVPCELHLRTSRISLQRTLDIGHINSYTPESFALRLETSGLLVRRLKAFDHPYAVQRFSAPPYKAALKTVLRRGVLGMSEWIACRVLTYHYGALCERGTALNI